MAMETLHFASLSVKKNVSKLNYISLWIFFSFAEKLREKKLSTDTSSQKPVLLNNLRLLANLFMYISNHRRVALSSHFVECCVLFAATHRICFANQESLTWQWELWIEQNNNLLQKKSQPHCAMSAHDTPNKSWFALQFLSVFPRVRLSFVSTQLTILYAYLSFDGPAKRQV